MAIVNSDLGLCHLTLDNTPGTKKRDECGRLEAVSVGEREGQMWERVRGTNVPVRE